MAVVFPHTESRLKVLRHWADVPDARRLRNEVPFRHWQAAHLLEYGTLVHRLEVLLHIAVAHRTPRIAAGRQFHAQRHATVGKQPYSTGSPYNELICRPRI